MPGRARPVCPAAAAYLAFSARAALSLKKFAIAVLFLPATFEGLHGRASFSF
jgi:hypothetical protein